jgi:hypothetical protein
MSKSAWTPCNQLGSHAGFVDGSLPLTKKLIRQLCRELFLIDTHTGIGGSRTAMKHNPIVFPAFAETSVPLGYPVPSCTDEIQVEKWYSRVYSTPLCAILTN